MQYLMVVDILLGGPGKRASSSRVHNLVLFSSTPGMVTMKKTAGPGTYALVP
jgi:hypothetical protein